MPKHAGDRQMIRIKQFCSVLALCAACSLAPPLGAQNLFSPAIQVNDAVITEFEIEQRQQFLTLLNAPGSSRQAVVEELINERLRAQAVANAGLELSDAALQEGMTEFAGRVNLGVDEFKTVLEENGIAAETFEDFVRVGVSWRDFIAARFGPRLQVSEEEIDQALGSTNGASNIQVLVSEIIIPAPPSRAVEVQEVAEQIAVTTSTEEFSEYARRFSATATRDQGGRLDWQPLSNLPPSLRPLLLGLAPGEVTEPLNIPEAVALFQLRDIRETGASTPEFAAIDYAVYYIPGGRSPAGLQQAARVEAQVDVCDDLYGVAQGQPPEVLERGSKPPSEIPTDIAVELSKLDPGETSIALTRAEGQTLLFLMMCGRTAAANEDVGRDEAARALRSSRLNAIAESFLEQLRADARIRIQ
ncbi:periplasmic chaperone for outer membrane proteins SurA [Roseobacter denitrificans OCh 114]|nr:periplasmic chaperone for outer membrane proteins SurA [Roseobacter denitrificans OCh 114]